MFDDLFDSYRQRRRAISTRESVATLDHMRDFFGNGENWAQHVYQGDDGGRCLVAAANHVSVSSIDDAKHWLRQAIEEITGLKSIEEFNDTRSNFAEIQDILARARELARTGGAKIPVLVGEIVPPVALPAPATATRAIVARAPAMPVAKPAKAKSRVVARRSTPVQRPSFWDWVE